MKILLAIIIAIWLMSGILGVLMVAFHPKGNELPILKFTFLTFLLTAAGIVIGGVIIAIYRVICG